MVRPPAAMLPHPVLRLSVLLMKAATSNTVQFSNNCIMRQQGYKGGKDDQPACAPSRPARGTFGYWS